jgi:hypothetical protein
LPGGDFFCTVLFQRAIGAFGCFAMMPFVKTLREKLVCNQGHGRAKKRTGGFAIDHASNL